MKKLLKILAGIVLSVLLLIVLGIAALVWLVNPNDYKPQLQQMAEKQHVELHIDGDLSWSFYPQFGIRTGKFSVKPDMKNVSKPFQFDSVAVSIKLLPLLHRQIVINHVKVRATEISLHDPAAGSDTTIRNLLIESRDLNLEQRTFPLSVSLEANTTKPPRHIQFKATTDTSLDHGLQHVLLNNLVMQVDDTHFTGSLDATLGSSPYLKVNLAGTRLDVDHYFPVVDDGHQGHTLTSHSDTKNTPDALIPVNTIQALPGDYHFSFDELILKHLHGDHFSTHLQISRDGVLSIQDITSGAYGGKLDMQGSINAQSAQPDVNMKIALENLNLEPALKDYFQLEKTFATGDFSFGTTVTTRGVTREQLMQGLAGEFSFNSKKVTLNNFDITSSLNTTLLQILQVKLPALASSENQTVFSDMQGKGAIEYGVIHNTSFNAQGPCSQFKGAGSYNLLNADVLYNMGITFPSADTNTVCSEINKKLKDIEWPVACKGSLDDGAAKICSADTAAIQSLIQKAATKQAGQKLEKKLDEKLQKKFGKDADAIKNSLKGLF